MDVLITPRHFEAIDTLAKRLPQLPPILDHCAKPVFDGSDPGVEWREGIAALAAHPQVSCKLSGLAIEFGPGWSAEALGSVFDHVLRHFGAERRKWDSAWPVLELAGSYPNWLAAAQQLTADLSPEARHQIFAATATRIYTLT